jgi:GxxExxY protein
MGSHEGTKGRRVTKEKDMDFYEWRERRGESADEESERLATLVTGAAIEVHKELGPGHPETVYEEARCHELDLRQIPYLRQVPVTIRYKGKDVGKNWIDLRVGDRLIVELKSIEHFSDVHIAQCNAYLAATRQRLALLINFKVALLKRGIKRVVCDRQ